MSGNKDQRGATDDEMSAEIERTMAEAEAAVSSLGDDEAEEIDEADIEDEVDVEAIVAEKDAQIAALKDKWLRAVADFENYKKRVKRDIDDAKARVTQSLLSAFLPTADNLERALEIAEPAAAQASDDNAANVEQVVKGLRMVRDEFLGALKKNDIEPVPSVGHPFDPAIHDALQQIDSPDHAPGVVVREFEKGFKLGERLLRPARVIIAGSGSGGATES
ncbi:MAG: nucleotide exchange factor GrpE [Myxococcales bacterium]|nr:nucleotide exchange factor GrpE [Myxococcales bacterium]MCB9713915.1 nucleotide exchange factor GrpE [Myxococcales bacterium]